MKFLLIFLTLFFNLNSFALTGSKTSEECKKYYITLINSNEELSNLSGSEQVDFFLNPESFLNHLKSLKNDKKLASCSQK